MCGRTPKILLKACLLLALLLPGFSQANTITLKTTVIGVPPAIQKNIADRLAITQTSAGDTLDTHTIQTFYKNAPADIQAAIQPFGYFHAQITPALTQQGDTWSARFVIALGPAAHITNTDIQVTGPGRETPSIQTLLQAFPLKPGQIFQAAAYDQAKQLLFQLANEAGYLKASYTQKIVRVDTRNNTVVIILHLDTGPRFYFGRVRFKQETFSEAFLDRFLSFQEGDPFSSAQLIKFQQNLSNSNYFQTVNVTPDLHDANERNIPIDVELTPNKGKLYRFGLGYGTFTGARATAGLSLRHLTDTGHHLDFQLKLSQVLSGLSAQYVIPGQNPLTDQYTIGADVQKFTPKNGNSISKSVSFGYVKAFHDWKSVATANYLREHYNIIGSPSYNSRILYPSLQLSRIQADDLINTRFGTKLDFLVRGANQHLVSNVSFAQGEIKGKLIFSPTQLSRVLVRGDFGYTVVKDLNTLPLSLQFFAGGLDSVRGFPYSYFGPGRYLKTASAEVQHRIYGNVSGSVFYDIGTADNHLNAPMGRGTGIGLIYESVIGPIKAYAGFGRLAQKPRHFAFELSLGPDL